MTSRQWRPIEDLAADWTELGSPELASLAPIWREQAAKLSQIGVLDEFNAKLRREWAIETGIIENVYSIDRGITQLLIEKGIEASLIPHGATDKPPEEIVAILKDHEGVLEGVFDFVAKRRLLSNSYIRELHQELMRSQRSVHAVNGAGQPIEVPLERGEWKQMPNNPTRPNGDVHEYCPPEHVQSEMERLVDLHTRHTESEAPPEVESAWLHHRFTEIHPFQDGNGRVARALSSLIFLRAGWFPLVVHRDIRGEYIECLEAADADNLEPLVQLFSKIQKRSFLRALNISEEVLSGHEPIRQVIAKAAERLKARFEGQIEKQREVFILSDRLKQIALGRMNQVAQEVDDEIKGIRSGYLANVDANDEDNTFWFKKQIVVAARSSNYFADTRTYAAWVRLKIREERQTELVISFHSIGAEFVGVLGVSAFLEHRDRTEEGEISIEGPYILSQEIFQFAFNEKRESVERRFLPWLERVLVSGIDQWRRQI